MKSLANRRSFLPALAVLLAAGLAGCTVSEQAAPALSGPSEFGLSVGLSATPDALPRDGAATSLVRIVARDPKGAAVAGQRLAVSANGVGLLSATDVTTDQNGQAEIVYTAPPASLNTSSVVISAVPIGTNFVNAVARTLSIALSASTITNTTFAVTPTTPGRGDLVTFDARTVQLNGTVCGGACVYSWNFGDGGTDSGDVVFHRFVSSGTFPVTLTILGPGGVTASRTSSITVGGQTGLTATITFSPTNPVTGQAVRIDGRSSVSTDGSQIVSYQWDLGNGEVKEGGLVDTVYSRAQTYTVRLTVRDSAGRSATTTATLTVTAPTP